MYAQLLEQDVGGRGHQYAQLVGQEVGATGAVDFQAALEFLDAVFRITPGAVDRAVEML